MTIFNKIELQIYVFIHIEYIDIQMFCFIEFIICYNKYFLRF